MSDGKTKIAVLGAGPAGLAAAFGLSDSAELRAQYDITVYQVGWRAGGKCATGRAAPGDHIEQNCTHYLFGCYENTFAMIRRAYAELHASGAQNFSQFEDTLLPRNLVVLKQFFNGNWHDWTFEFPTNNAQPGRGGELPPTSDYITMTLEWLLQMVLGWRSIRALDRVEQSLRDSRSSELWQQTLGRFERLFDASFYTTWCGTDITLERGKDFDQLVFALPHSVMPFYCRKILAAQPSWQQLVEHNPTVESQSLRLWFRLSLRQLGWTKPVPILSGYATPYCTWEDDGQLSEVETWPNGDIPQAIACVFGPLAAPEFAPGPEHADYPQQQQARVEQPADKFMQQDAAALWPKVGTPENPRAINPELLILQSQRANAGPLERYTMTWSGSLRYRLRADESGYSNLFLAGDWVRNGLEAGSIEGTMMAGLQASRAICGYPECIVGESDSYH